VTGSCNRSAFFSECKLSQRRSPENARELYVWLPTRCHNASRGRGVAAELIVSGRIFVLASTDIETVVPWIIEIDQASDRFTAPIG
jgi:hypothetical protein